MSAFSQFVTYIFNEYLININVNYKTTERFIQNNQWVCDKLRLVLHLLSNIVRIQTINAHGNNPDIILLDISFCFSSLYIFFFIVFADSFSCSSTKRTKINPTLIWIVIRCSCIFNVMMTQNTFDHRLMVWWWWWWWRFWWENYLTNICLFFFYVRFASSTLGHPFTRVFFSHWCIFLLMCTDSCVRVLCKKIKQGLCHVSPVIKQKNFLSHGINFLSMVKATGRS